jgi:hypothetical protein
MALRKPPQKTILMTLGALVILGVFFFLYSSSSNEDETLLEEAASQTPAAAGSEDVVRLLGELQTVDFSRETLEAPVFKSLTDWSVTLTPESPGRTNPFAPIGAGGSPDEN